MTKLKKREKKKKADQTGDKGLQECFAYQGSPTTQKFTLNCLSKLTGQLSPAPAPGQPQQPPSHSTNAKGSKESNHLKPKGISAHGQGCSHQALLTFSHCSGHRNETQYSPMLPGSKRNQGAIVVSFRSPCSKNSSKMNTRIQQMFTRSAQRPLQHSLGRD